MIADAPVAAHATPDFDRLARVYRWMEWASFGPFLGWCRQAFLAEMTVSRRALVIGDGDGRFTSRLLRTNPDVSVDAIDASTAMLRSLVHRACSHAARLRTKSIDVRDWNHPSRGAAYDLIVTHFFLDCLTTEEVQSLAMRIKAVSAPGALWVVSEFSIPKNWFGRVIAAPLIRALYAAFGWMTGLEVCQLPDYSAALRSGGFRLQAMRSRLGGLLTSELWALPNPANPTNLPHRYPAMNLQ